MIHHSPGSHQSSRLTITHSVSESVTTITSRASGDAKNVISIKIVQKWKMSKIVKNVPWCTIDHHYFQYRLSCFIQRLDTTSLRYLVIWSNIFFAEVSKNNSHNTLMSSVLKQVLLLYPKLNLSPVDIVAILSLHLMLGKHFLVICS